jgi:DNA polymerase-3 subunit gamma/tau
VTETFAIKYRPTELDEIIGQDSIIQSLENIFNSGKIPHAFLFTGASGVGKTTISRIVAYKLEATEIIEIDGASFGGVEFMREFIEKIKLHPFDIGTRMVIIDECHTLSIQAWQTLLKIIEEPPSFLYFAFCTTEIGKVPNTIKTRCLSYQLNELEYDDIVPLLDYISHEEGLGFSEEMLELIAIEASGSMRTAIMSLQKAIGCKTLKQVSNVIGSTSTNTEVIELCRALVNNANWNTITKLLKGIKNTNHEAARIHIVNYINSCLLNSKTEKETLRLLNIVVALAEPLGYTNTFACLVSKIGAAIYGE